MPRGLDAATPAECRQSRKGGITTPLTATRAVSTLKKAIEVPHVWPLRVVPNEQISKGEHWPSVDWRVQEGSHETTRHLPDGRQCRWPDAPQPLASEGSSRRSFSAG